MTTLPDNLPLAGHWLVPSETFAEKEDRRYWDYLQGNGWTSDAEVFGYSFRTLPRPLYTRTGRPM